MKFYVDSQTVRLRGVVCRKRQKFSKERRKTRLLVETVSGSGEGKRGRRVVRAEKGKRQVAEL